MKRENVKDILLEDLIEYTGKPPQLVINRCYYAKAELAWKWLEWSEKKEGIVEFYRNTDLYIFDLTYYQLGIVSTVDKMIEETKKLRLKKILDFGGGIGEYTIRFMKETKTEITFLELKNSITMSYAKYRFRKHKISPKIVDETYPWQDEKWDGIIAMDVLEHLEDPATVISSFERSAQYLWTNPQEVKYDVYYPQHISRYRLVGFQRIGRYLWRNKKL